MKAWCVSTANFLLILSSIVGTGMRAAAPQQAQTGSAELVRKSSLIFAGTVTKPGQSSLPLVRAGKQTAVVKVDEVLRNAGVATDISGKEVTLQLKDPGSVREGERAIFFCNVTVYGKSIAAAEVGRMAATAKDVEEVRTQVRDIEARLPDERGQQRIAQAEMIVTGTVTAVEPLGGKERRPGYSEHNEDLWKATVRVESTSKGQAPAGNVTVFFAHSDDIRWAASPKFKVGQRGVFLLRRPGGAELAAQGYTALDRDDFQPIEQMERIKRLVP